MNEYLWEEYILEIYGVGSLIIGFNRAEAFSLLNEIERLEYIDTYVIRRGDYVEIPLKIKKGGIGRPGVFERGDLLYNIPLNNLTIPLKKMEVAEASYSLVGKVIEGIEYLDRLGRVTKAVLKKRVK